LKNNNLDLDREVLRPHQGGKGEVIKKEKGTETKGQGKTKEGDRMGKRGMEAIS